METFHTQEANQSSTYWIFTKSPLAIRHNIFIIIIYDDDDDDDDDDDANL